MLKFGLLRRLHQHRQLILTDPFFFSVPIILCFKTNESITFSLTGQGIFVEIGFCENCPVIFLKFPYFYLFVSLLVQCSITDNLSPNWSVILEGTRQALLRNSWSIGNFTLKILFTMH